MVTTVETRRAPLQVNVLPRKTEYVSPSDVPEGYYSNTHLDKIAPVYNDIIALRRLMETCDNESEFDRIQFIHHQLLHLLTEHACRVEVNTLIGQIVDTGNGRRLLFNGFDLLEMNRNAIKNNPSDTYAAAELDGMEQIYQYMVDGEANIATYFSPVRAGSSYGMQMIFVKLGSTVKMVVRAYDENPDTGLYQSQMRFGDAWQRLTGRGDNPSSEWPTNAEFIRKPIMYRTAEGVDPEQFVWESLLDVSPDEARLSAEMKSRVYHETAHLMNQYYKAVEQIALLSQDPHPTDATREMMQKLEIYACYCRDIMYYASVQIADALRSGQMDETVQGNLAVLMHGSVSGGDPHDQTDANAHLLRQQALLQMQREGLRYGSNCASGGTSMSTIFTEVQSNGSMSLIGAMQSYYDRVFGTGSDTGEEEKARMIRKYLTLNKYKEVTLTCPKCKHTQVGTVGSYMKTDKISCSCGLCVTGICNVEAIVAGALKKQTDTIHRN